MQTFNRIANAIFDPLLRAVGHDHPVFDLLVWPVLMGLLAMAVYKAVSNQRALARVKSQISMRLLEIRLFSHDIFSGAALDRDDPREERRLSRQPHAADGGHARAVRGDPGAARRELRLRSFSAGAVELLHVQLDPEAKSPRARRRSRCPTASRLTRPGRHGGHPVFWRVRAEQPRDHILRVSFGGETYEKAWAVGGDARARCRCAGCAGSRRSFIRASPRCRATGWCSRSSSACTRAR